MDRRAVKSGMLAVFRRAGDAGLAVAEWMLGAQVCKVAGVTPDIPAADIERVLLRGLGPRAVGCQVVATSRADPMPTAAVKVVYFQSPPALDVSMAAPSHGTYLLPRGWEKADTVRSTQATTGVQIRCSASRCGWMEQVDAFTVQGLVALMQSAAAGHSKCVRSASRVTSDARSGAVLIDTWRVDCSDKVSAAKLVRSLSSTAASVDGQRVAMDASYVEERHVTEESERSYREVVRAVADRPRPESCKNARCVLGVGDHYDSVHGYVVARERERPAVQNEPDPCGPSRKRQRVDPPVQLPPPSVLPMAVPLSSPANDLPVATAIQQPEPQKCRVRVRLPGAILWYSSEAAVPEGTAVIVEGDRGERFGFVDRVALATGGGDLPKLPSVLRVADQDDFGVRDAVGREEHAALALAREICSIENPEMEILNAEYQQDMDKVTFFYSCAGYRPKFDSACRKLFSKLHCRIWFERVTASG